jgi:hypothetical protein
MIELIQLRSSPISTQLYILGYAIVAHADSKIVASEGNPLRAEYERRSWTLDVNESRVHMTLW